ncbi:hypothetical protein NUSPORA_00486 [Nucleospora cyclopteri]
MILNFGFLFNSILCASKKNEYEFGTSTLFPKSNLKIDLTEFELTLYDFNRPLNALTILDYYKTLIEKIAGSYLIKKCIRNCKVNKYMFKTYILKIYIGIKDIQVTFANILDSKTLYRKLENKLLIFYYKKILRIIEAVDYKNVEIKVLKQDKSCIDELLYDLNSIMIQEYLCDDSNLFFVFNELSTVIQNKQDNLVKSIRQYVYNKCDYFDDFLYEYEKLMMPYEDLVCPKFDKLRDVGCIKPLEIRTKWIHTEQETLKEIFYEKINLNLDNFDESIAFKINIIHEIITSLFKLADYSISTSQLLNISLYYNYLEKKIFIKRINLKNNITNDHIYFVKNYTEENIKKCITVENMLKSIKLMLLKLFYNLKLYEKSRNDSELKDKMIKSTDFWDIVRFCDFKNMIDIEDFFVIIYKLDDTTNLHRFTKNHCIYEQIKTLNLLNNILQKKYNDYMQYNLFLKNFIFFKMRAIIETRLFLIYFYFKVKFNDERYLGFYNIICKRIQEINNYSKELKSDHLLNKKDPNRVKKTLKLLELFEDHYKNQINNCKNLEEEENENEKQENLFEPNKILENFYFVEFNAEFLQYEIENYMLLNH